MNTYVTGTKQILVNVHNKNECKKEFCTIHKPSNHHMKNWPTNWRSGGVLDIKPPHFERICPHGIGHPDPDSIAEGIEIHGCDGCCQLEGG